MTPMASQVSMYDTVKPSTSMPLQDIKQSSHDSNSNNYNPMSMKEPLEKKTTLCPTSDLNQSGDHSASMNTSGKTRPSSHSTYERLWNDVNQLDTFSDWNCSSDHDEILHQHPPQSQNMSTTINADEVITLSATDLVCNISSISSNARYSYPEVDKDLIPRKLSQPDMDWAIKKWKYAR